jgi:trehalose-6-phosphate synthase
MLLPQLLRQQSRATIVSSCTSPFLLRDLPAAAETWRRKSWRAPRDLIGHTYDYAQHFLRSVLGSSATSTTWARSLPNHLAKVDTFPDGRISRDRYAAAGRSTGGPLREIPKVSRWFCPQIVDYTKGIQRLQGYDLFSNRTLRQKKVVLVLVACLAIGVDQYQEIKRQIDELVDRSTASRQCRLTPCCISTVPALSPSVCDARSHVALRRRCGRRIRE